MFEALAAKMEAVFKKLRGRGRLTVDDIQEGLREVRLALLEADVHFKVVKDLLEKVRERAIGQEVIQSLTPGQQVVKIVYEELVQQMGPPQVAIKLSSEPPTVIMMVGLQGSGKTTTAGKLARHLKRQGRHPYLVPADVSRPAAIEQMRVIAGQLGIAVFPATTSERPLKICQRALEEARLNGKDVVIIDTAGRLHIDPTLMAELQTIKAELKPHETLLVVDAMTGQDAVNVARQFDEALNLDGIVLTKMDGDARGGAALSMRAVTGKVIKLIGTGEKLEMLEPFYPDRLVSRLLGMGDVLSLIEKAHEAISADQARRLQQKLREDSFTLTDFRDQLAQVKRLGPVDQLLEMIPGVKGLTLPEGGERELVKIEAIINSMTWEERADCSLIDGSRRRRIARGSGTTVQDVNRLLRQFTQTKKLVKQLSKRKGLSRFRIPGGMLPQ